MEEICPHCGLPKTLCVCEEIAKESQKIKIRTDSRRYGKIVTIVSGMSNDVNTEELLRDLKRQLACGGTIKNKEIVLQGNHREKVKQMLLRKGFKEGLIDA